MSGSGISVAANNKAHKTWTGTMRGASGPSDVAHGFRWRFAREYDKRGVGSEEDGGEKAKPSKPRQSRAVMPVTWPVQGEERMSKETRAIHDELASCAKAVEQLDPNSGEVIHRWPSMTAAGAALGLVMSSISEAAHGKRVRAGSYRWRFACEQDRIASEAANAKAAEDLSRTRGIAGSLRGVSDLC